MKAPPSLTMPFLLFILTLLSNSVATVSATSRHHRQLGFFYTRARGRCTAEYWSSVGGGQQWPRMVPSASTVSKLLGSMALDQRFRSDLTLLESMAIEDSRRNDAFAKVLKQGIAALLNTYSREGYPFRSWEVKSMLIEAMVSKEDAAALSLRLATANQACT